MKNVYITLALLSALVLVGCTADQVTTSLEAAVDAAIAADSIARPQDAAYLATATGCMNAAVAELGTADSLAIKSTKISLACAEALSAGADAPIGVQATVAALSKFLRTVEGTKTAYQFSSPAMVTAFNSSTAGQVSAHRLKRIQKKLAKLKAPKRSRLGSIQGGPGGLL